MGFIVLTDIKSIIASGQVDTQSSKFLRPGAETGMREKKVRI